MKKLFKLSLILLMAVFITGNVYAASGCDVNMKTLKKEFSKNEEFVVDVDIANIKSARGIISIGGTLEYDRSSLTLVKMEGLNGWESPGINTSYNEENGKFAITRSGLGKKDETILKLTFKVKEESKENLMISLKNITVADGTAPIKVNATSINLTIKDGTKNPVPQPEPDEPDQNNTINNDTSKPNTNNNSNKTNSTIPVGDSVVTDKKLPQTGETDHMLPILVGITIVLAIALVIRIHIINKKRINIAKD